MPSLTEKMVESHGHMALPLKAEFQEEETSLEKKLRKMAKYRGYVLRVLEPEEMAALVEYEGLPQGYVMVGSAQIAFEHRESDGQPVAFKIS